jgi:hypothetical protein
MKLIPFFFNVLDRAMFLKNIIELEQQVFQVIYLRENAQEMQWQVWKS